MAPALKSGLALIPWLLLVFAAAAFGAQFTPGPWYAVLAKPDWTPPNWLFGPVWTALYLAMAVAAWRVAGRNSSLKVTALILFVAQLGVNALWSWLFFGRHELGQALADILVLDLLVLICLLLFWRIDRLAGLLLAPYLLWIGYASALNWRIWQLNAL